MRQRAANPAARCPTHRSRVWVFCSIDRRLRTLSTLALLLLIVDVSWLRAAAAPDLTLTNLDGKTRSLSDYRGKIVVLNFWATWCLPCRHEMPMLSRLASTYEAKDVLFLAISIDDAKTQTKIPHFLQKRKISLEVLTGATPDNLKELNLAEIIPATLIFDRDGTPVFRIEGEASKKDVSSRVDWLLSERVNKQPKILIKNY
jgi:thiol-disulfide isomerase/thioredoxin